MNKLLLEVLDDRIFGAQLLLQEVIELDELAVHFGCLFATLYYERTHYAIVYVQFVQSSQLTYTDVHCTVHCM